MGKRDPNEGLAADAALAEDLGDENERRAGQLEYYGGTVDDIDSENLEGLDDGSSFDPDNPAPPASQDDEKEEEEADDDDEVDDSADAEKDESGEEEPEKTDDADPDDDSKTEDEPAAKEKGIPKHRFDEVNERRKAAEAELAAYKAKETAKEEAAVEKFDFRANEKLYMELMLDGDVDGALAKREEIDAAKESKWKTETTTATKVDLDVQAEQNELVSLSQEAEAMFDVFDPDSDNFNQGMLNKVLTFMRGYEADETMSRSDAFVQGLADVIEMYDLMPEEAATKKTGKTTTPTGQKKTGGKAKETARANAHQPVGTTGKGSADTGAVVPDVDQMSDEEIDALPAKTLARLRGDFM